MTEKGEGIETEDGIEHDGTVMHEIDNGSGIFVRIAHNYLTGLIDVMGSPTVLADTELVKEIMKLVYNMSKKCINENIRFQKEQGLNDLEMRTQWALKEREICEPKQPKNKNLGVQEVA